MYSLCCHYVPPAVFHPVNMACSWHKYFLILLCHIWKKETVYVLVVGHVWKSCVCWETWAAHLTTKQSHRASQFAYILSYRWRMKTHGFGRKNSVIIATIWPCVSFLTFYVIHLHLHCLLKPPNSGLHFFLKSFERWASLCVAWADCKQFESICQWNTKSLCKDQPEVCDKNVQLY